MTALAEVIEVNLADFVDDLAYQLTRLHVIQRIFKNATNNTAARAFVPSMGNSFALETAHH